MDKDKAAEAFDRALNTTEPAFEKFFLSRLLDLRFAYTDETCTVSFEIQDFMFNPQGSLHGGLIATVMDISMGHLIKHRIGPGATLEMKVQYLKPLRTGTATAIGRFLQPGKSTHFMRSDLSDADGTLCAFASATWKTASVHATRP